MNSREANSDSSAENSVFIHPNAEAELAGVAVKLPPFWKPDPRVWFLQTEAVFRTSRVTADQSKFDYVVRSIDTEILCQVSDIIVNPPKENKYECIKNRLIVTFAESETQRIRKLLNDLELGDRKPSQLLCEMRNLADNKVNEKFLKSLWLQRLPMQMQTILATSSEDLPTLSLMADQVWELQSTAYQAATISSNNYDSCIADLKNEIAELKMEVSFLRERSCPANSSNQPFTRARNTSRERNSQSVDICYYHQRFGGRAYKCTPPCQFQKGNNKDQGNARPDFFRRQRAGREK